VPVHARQVQEHQFARRGPDGGLAVPRLGSRRRYRRWGQADVRRGVDAREVILAPLPPTPNFCLCATHRLEHPRRRAEEKRCGAASTRFCIDLRPFGQIRDPLNLCLLASGSLTPT